MLLAPGGHDEGVVDGDAGNLLHAFSPQLRRLLYEAGQVSLQGQTEGDRRGTEREARYGQRSVRNHAVQHRNILTH